MTSGEQSRAEAAIRLLEASGFDTSAMWRELESRCDLRDKQPPSEHDIKWATRAAKPTPIAEHLMEEHVTTFPIELEDGRRIWVKQTTVDPEILTAANCFEDRQYSLSSGQRQTLREAHDMTPTKIVVVSHVETFPGTNVIRTFTLENGQHIDPRARKHVLSKVVIFPAADFFAQSEERMKEKEAGKENFTELVEGALTVGRIINLVNEDRWAIADLCGVKVQKQVEVLRVNEDTVTFLCYKSGNKATVDKKELLTTVEEYVKLYKVEPRKGTRSAAKFDATPALDALIDNLMK